MIEEGWSVLRGKQIRCFFRLGATFNFNILVYTKLIDIARFLALIISLSVFEKRRRITDVRHANNMTATQHKQGEAHI